MQLVIDPDIAAFEVAARDLLDADEAVNAVLLAGIDARRNGPAPVADTYVARIVEGDRTLLPAMRFAAPRGLALGAGPAAAAVKLAEGLVRLDPGLPSVSGPDDGTAAFASAWTAITGGGARQAMSTDIMVLREVIRPRPIAGTMRLAEPGDAATLAPWLEAFAREATPHERLTRAEADANVARAVAAGRFSVWDVDGEPWGMASTSRPTRTGIAINAVYTPPDLRGRGIAANLVASMAARELLAGKAFCCLYVDRTNPISNRVYRTIGFAPVAGSALWMLASPAA